MLSYILGFVGGLIGVVGWFKLHSAAALIIGFVLYLLETALELRRLNNNALTLDVMLFAGGCIGALVMHQPWYLGGLLVINIYSLIMSAVSLPMMLVMLFRIFH